MSLPIGNKGDRLPSVHDILRLHDGPLPRIDEVVLPPETAFAVEATIRELLRGDRLAEFGLRPARKIIFHGPSGCGKTTAAEAVAGELGMPLMSVVNERPHKNMRRVFEFARTCDAVILLDLDFVECLNAHTWHYLAGVNIGGSVLLATSTRGPLGATYFDRAIHFPAPSGHHMARDFLKSMLRGVRYSFDLDEEARKFYGMRYAEVRRVVQSAIKLSILGNSGPITSRDLADAFLLERRT